MQFTPFHVIPGGREGDPAVRVVQRSLANEHELHLVALHQAHSWIPFPALRAAGDDTDGGGICRNSAMQFTPDRVIPGWSRAAAEGKGILP
jgi:hypothetical protein